MKRSIAWWFASMELFPKAIHKRSNNAKWFDFTLNGKINTKLKLHRSSFSNNCFRICTHWMQMIWWYYAIAWYVPNSEFRIHIFTIPIWNMIRANAFQNTNTQYTCRIWHDCHFQHENRLFTEWSTLKLEFRFHLKKMLLVSGLMWLNSMCVRYTTS